MQPNLIEVSFTPAEFAAFQQRDLSNTVCVVFDVLRATSSMLTAFNNGAKAVIPVREISEALACKRQQPDIWLAGEREGLRIRGEQTGGIDFDFGNSPFDFTTENVRGKSIVWTTTNGTRALQACLGAKHVFISSFANLKAMAGWIEANRPPHLLLVCAGTKTEAAYEDALAAGALADLVWPNYVSGAVADSAQIARQLYISAKHDLPNAIQLSQNGRRLLSNPDLRRDVPFCFQRDTADFVAEMKNGTVERC